MLLGCRFLLECGSRRGCGIRRASRGSGDLNIPSLWMVGNGRYLMLGGDSLSEDPFKYTDEWEDTGNSQRGRTQLIHTGPGAREGTRALNHGGL